MLKSDLTPEQRECVEFDKHQHLLIKGPPGSGKTWVLLYRGKHLSSQKLFDLMRFTAKDPRRAEFITDTHALTNYAAELNEGVTDTKMAADAWKKARVAQTCLQFFWGIMSQLGIGKPVIDDTRRREMIIRSIESVRHELAGKASLRILDNSIQWWLDEFRWIKGTLLPDGRIILTSDDYKGAERTGRGMPLQPASRAVVWRVFGTYESFLRTLHYRPKDYLHPAQTTDEIDFDDYARQVAQAFCTHSKTSDCRRVDVPAELEPYRVDHLLVDESQALTQLQLLLLSKFARKTITLVQDEAQNISRTPFTYESIELKFNSGNVRTLRFSFRSTRQIHKLADALRGPEVGDQGERIEVPRNGPVPKLHVASSAQMENDIIVRLAGEEHRNNPDKTIALLVRENQALDKLEVLLKAQGIVPIVLRWRDPKTGSPLAPQHVKPITRPGVKLITYRAAQGLEFDIIILTHVTEGKLPQKPRQYHSEMAEMDEAEFLASERRLLYVGMTRARHVLHMTCTEPRSRFLLEPYATAYETVGPAVPATVPADDLDMEEMISLDDFDDLPL